MLSIMKIELNENKILFNNGTSSKEIHPFWLRERVNNEEYLDKKTQQRKTWIRPDKTPCDNDRRRIRLDKVLAREGSHSVTWPMAWS